MIRKFLKGFSFAFKGIAYAFSTQINFKVHIVSAIAVCALGYYSGLNCAEWLWIFSAILLVLIAELFNTAIEVLVDLVSPGYDPKAGIIKDLASAAVLITGLLALIIGLVIFIPKYF